jgi:hypothetical protein
MTTMQTDGFPLNNKKYNDGPHNSVNWHDDAVMKSAIYSHGPVKIGVAAQYFQSAAPGQHGVVTPGTSGMGNIQLPSYDRCPGRPLRQPLRLRKLGAIESSI